MGLEWNRSYHMLKVFIYTMSLILKGIKDILLALEVCCIGLNFINEYPKNNNNNSTHYKAFSR